LELFDFENDLTHPDEAEDDLYLHGDGEEENSAIEEAYEDFGEITDDSISAVSEDPSTKVLSNFKARDCLEIGAKVAMNRMTDQDRLKDPRRR
jgi:ribosomal protein L5